MGHSYKIIPEENLVINTITDDFNFSEYQTLMEEILNDERFIPSMNMFWDFRQSTLAEFTPVDIDLRKDYVKRNQKRRGKNYRVASLVNKTVDYGISRMYQMVSQDLPVNFQVFYDEKAAFNWIRQKNHNQRPLESFDSGYLSSQPFINP